MIDTIDLSFWNILYEYKPLFKKVDIVRFQLHVK
jgi:hypothetical protein